MTPVEQESHSAAGDPAAGTVLNVPEGAAAATRLHRVDDIIIGAGVCSTGTLSTDGAFCIDGTLRDAAVSADVLSIGEGAEFSGTAQARQIEVLGRVHGELIATEQLVLRASARVLGRISAPCVVMHRGAILSGEVNAASQLPACPDAID